MYQIHLHLDLSNHYIRQKETGVVYSGAVDVEDAPYTYEETDELIETTTDEIESYDYRVGYPNKLEGENIPIESQIILIVDSYCALLEKRPYRPAQTREEAIETIMRDANSKWSARLANEFSAVMKEDLI